MQNEESAAPAEGKPRPMFRLKLDHDDVYFGCELFSPDGTIGASDVILDHAPDNVPGRYRWSREHDRLEPLPKEKQKAEPGAPTLEQAFYDFVKYGPNVPRLTAWCAWFEKSIEAQISPKGK